MTRDEWASAKENDERIATIDSKFVVLSGVADVVIIATGSGEYDELGRTSSPWSRCRATAAAPDPLCSSLVPALPVTGVTRVLIACLREALKKEISESVVISKYSQVLLVLDELINEGMLEQVDGVYAKRLTKLEIKL